MVNQDGNKISEAERQRLQSEQLESQTVIPAASGFEWWGWIWFVVGIVVFVWLLGWGW
jgi:hypothetical protein